MAHICFTKLEFTRDTTGRALFSLLQMPPFSVVFTCLPSLISFTCPAPTGTGTCAAFSNYLSGSPSSPSFSGHIGFLSVSSVPWVPFHLSMTYRLCGKAASVSLLCVAFFSFLTCLICAPFRTHIQGHCSGKPSLTSRVIYPGDMFSRHPFALFRCTYHTCSDCIVDSKIHVFLTFSSFWTWQMSYN